MFDAMDKRDAGGVLHQTLIFVPLLAAVVVVAAAATYAKTTLQRRWRTWLNARVLDRWLTSGRYYQLNLVPGDHTNPEYRVAEDLRLSVDAPVELAIGIFAAVSSAIVFISVLWFIGGQLAIPIGNTNLHIPGFLVVAAFVYAVLASGSMVVIAHGFVKVSENKNQAEANYRYVLTRLRENGESIALLGGEAEERAGLERLPNATVISVGHRPELEAFHTRKLVLQHRADGARLVSDEALQRTFGRSARVLSKLLTGRRKRNVASR